MTTDPPLAHFENLFGPEFGHGRGFDLAPLRSALFKLGDPHLRLPGLVHVAGTNGKGSTLAFLRAIAEAAGLSVNAFTKPHMIALRERFLLRGALIDDVALIEAADRVAATGEGISQFEAQVAAAFHLFAANPAELTLIETGFGGRDDATNVLPTPAMTILTPIDFDHQDILGDTLAKIAAHKAGIIKPGAAIVSARQAPEAQDIIDATAVRAHASLRLCGRDFDAYARHGRFVLQTSDRLIDLPSPALHGAHQIENAGVAAMAALLLNDSRIDEDALARGFQSVRWAGRLQPLMRGPLAARAHAAGAEIWIDGGHNPHAARALAAALRDLARSAPRPALAIVALRARKDGLAFVEALAPALDRLIAVTVPGGAASHDPQELARAARERGIKADGVASLDNALKLALADAQAPRILICGSLALAGAALKGA